MPSSGVLAENDTSPDIDSRSLPQGYGATMAALMPRDPNWMYLYWEITPDSRVRIMREHGPDIFEKSRQVLRVYDMSAPENGDPRYFDVAVRLEAASWYVHVQDGGRSYCCEMGLVPPAGGFIGIIKSNTVILPAGLVSDVMDGKWMAVSEDFDRLLQLSGVEYIGKVPAKSPNPWPSAGRCCATSSPRPPRGEYPRSPPWPCSAGPKVNSGWRRTVN